MKNKKLQTLLEQTRTQPALRPTETFWRDCWVRAASGDDADDMPPPRHLRRRISGFYPALASLASAAAGIIIYFSVQSPPETFRALNSFKLGEKLENNGAVVLTDKQTNATILWVMTDDAGEDIQ